MTQKIKIGLREREVGTTKAKSLDDSIELSKKIDPYHEIESVAASQSGVTSTSGMSADIIDHSWRFITTPPPKTKEMAKPKLAPEEAEDVLRKIDSILESPDWDKKLLIKYSDTIAEEVNSLLRIKEKEKDVEGVSHLSKSLASLFRAVHKAIGDKDKEMSTKYGLYASFWDLKANLTKE